VCWRGAGGEGLIPAEVIAERAASARLVPLRLPADSAEPGYTPSAKLADFVRCQDLTCRAPGCDRPAPACDVDHTIPYARGGVTHPSNLKCLCRLHHLLKTFWGWRDEQLPDVTIIWTSPTCTGYAFSGDRTATAVRAASVCRLTTVRSMTPARQRPN
jgi:hypothetical protein